MYLLPGLKASSKTYLPGSKSGGQKKKLLPFILVGSDSGVVDNTLDYQSRGCKIDPPLLWSFG